MRNRHPVTAVLGRLAIGVLTLAVIPALSLAEPPSPPKPAEHGVVVLRNGEVLTGRVARVEGGWEVIVPEGTIRLRASEVDCCCDSLEQAYQRMHAALAPNSLYDHLRLAQWCVHQGLMERAAEQITESSQIDPNHPMVDVLRRRLELAKQQPEHGKPAVKSDAPPTASGEDLDRALRGLPPTTVEVFVQRVQPILVNSCTACGCHGTQTTSNYRLQRAPADRAPARRVTQRNLLATLQWINRENPAASKLLTIPLQPHGANKLPVFTNPQTAAYQRLVEWVNTLSTTDTPTAPAISPVAVVSDPNAAADSNAAMTPLASTAPVMDTPAARMAQARQAAAARTLTPSYTTPGSPPGSGIHISKRATAAKVPTASAEAPGTGPSASSESAAKPADVQRRANAPSPSFVPSDPFDAEIYNRRVSAGQQ